VLTFAIAVTHFTENRVGIPSFPKARIPKPWIYGTTGMPGLDAGVREHDTWERLLMAIEIPDHNYA
jgi:hypothetical protein